MTTIEIQELRCPAGPNQLLLKLRLDGERPHVDADSNCLEISCRDCARASRKTDPSVRRVLHRFNFIGELVESIVERDS